MSYKVWVYNRLDHRRPILSLIGGNRKLDSGSGDNGDDSQSL